MGGFFQVFLIKSQPTSACTSGEVSLYKPVLPANFLLALRIMLLSLHKGKFPGGRHAAAVCVCLLACLPAGLPAGLPVCACFA
jgi:hypothetical protein